MRLRMLRKMHRLVTDLRFLLTSPQNQLAQIFWQVLVLHYNLLVCCLLSLACYQQVLYYAENHLESSL